MRTRKAFIAGLGTTGALMAAMVCMFAIVSAIVAFEGWPSLHLGRSATTLEDSGTRAAVAPQGAGATPDGDAGVDRASAAHSGSDRRHGHRRGVDRLGERPAQGSGDGSVPISAGGDVKGVAGVGTGGSNPTIAEPSTADRAPDGGRAATPPDPSDGPSDPAPAAPPSQPPPPSGGSGQPPASGGGGLGETVNQVTTGVGGVVTQTGSNLGGTVTTTTGQVGAVVGQVSPQLGQTVTQTGQVVGGVVTGTTGTVGQVVQGTGGVVGGLLGGLGGRRPAATR